MKKQKFKIFTKQLKIKEQTDNNTDFMLEGIASTTNKDLAGDIISEDAIKDMKEQLINKSINLQDSHQYGLKDIAGVITDVVKTDNSELRILARIVPNFQSIIKGLLDTGVNLGLSIGGRVKDYETIKESRGWVINKFHLSEISLTPIPANIDTYGTVSLNKEIVTDCFGKACRIIRKTQEKKQNNEEEVNYMTEKESTDLFNELWTNKQEELVETVAEQYGEKMMAEVKESVLNSVKELVAEAVTEALAQESSKKPEEPVKEETEEKKDYLTVDDFKAGMEAFGSQIFKQIGTNRNPEFKANPNTAKNIPADQEQVKTITTRDLAQKMADNLTKEDMLKKYVASQL